MKVDDAILPEYAPAFIDTMPTGDARNAAPTDRKMSLV